MQKTMNYRLFAVVIGGMACIFLVFFLILHGQASGKREQETTLRATLISLEEKNKEMDAQLKLVDTDDYVVTSAMTNYAFMNRNDLRFHFGNPEALYAYTEEELKILMDEIAD